MYYYVNRLNLSCTSKLDHELVLAKLTSVLWELFYILLNCKRHYIIKYSYFLFKNIFLRKIRMYFT